LSPDEPRDDGQGTDTTADATEAAAVDAGGAESPPPPSGRRPARVLRRVMGLIFLALALALFQFTQTSTGRNAAISLLRGALEKAVHGEVEIGPVLGGNLLTRLTLARFAIADSAGNTLVALDTVRLEYSPLSFVRREVRIRRLDAARAEIRLAQGADGVWNYDRIFGGGAATAAPPPPEAAGDTIAAAPPPDSSAIAPAPAGLRLILGDATVHDGTVELRTPWTATLEGRRRALAFEDDRTGRSPWYTEETPDGELERVARIEGLAGQFPLLRLADTPRPMQIDLAGVSGHVLAVKQPLDIASFSGALTLGDSIRVTIDRLESAGSRLSGAGWVAAGDPISFSFDLEADPISFEDLAWLPLAVPSSGGGPLDLRLYSRGETTVVDVTNGVVQSGETSIRGGFRVALGDPPRFESVDVDLQPLRLAWLDDLLHREPLADGLVRGSVSASGPVGNLTIDADLTVQDTAGAGFPSRIHARGGVSLEEPYPLRDLTLELGAFEPRWTRILGIDTPIPGRVMGTVTLSSPARGTITFRGGLSHTTPTGEVSSLAGAGTVDYAEGSVIDVSLEASPLALAALEPWVPDVDLVGAVSGPIRARGSRSALQGEADLDTPRGHLRFDGLFGLDPDRPRYDATVEASDIALDQWIESAPTSRLAVRGRVTGEGVDPETLDARFDLEILPSELDRARIQSSQVGFRVRDGLAEIDTLVVLADVGSVVARGSFGLAPERTGTIEFEGQAADLSELNRWVAEEIPGGREAQAEDALFADFEAALAGPDPDETVEGLLGRAVGHGSLSGTLERFSIEAFVDATDIRFEDWGADTLSARVQLPDARGTREVNAAVTARDVLIRGISVDSLEADGHREGDGPVDLGFYARRDSTLDVSGRGAFDLATGLDARLETLRFRLGKLESSLLAPARFVYSDSTIRAEGILMSGPLGRLEADGALLRDGSEEMTVRAVGVRIDQLGYLLSATPTYGGTLSLNAALAGTPRYPTFRGTLQILDPAVREHQYSSLDARFEYGAQRLTASVDLMGEGVRLARAEGNVHADLALMSVEQRLLDEPLDIRIVADSLPLQLLELRVRGLEEIDGHAIGSISFSGAPGELRYGGDLRVIQGQAWVPDLGVRMVGVSGSASFRGREARVDSLVLRSARGGRARVSGQLDLGTLSNPGLALDLRANGIRAIARRDVALAIDGTGHLGGTYRAPVLTGGFRLRDGDIYQDEFLRERQVLDLSDPQFYSLLDSTAVRERHLLDRFRNPFMDNLQIDVQLDLGPNLWLRSPTLDVEMVADGLDVQMNRATDAFLVTGVVDLPRGTYRFDRLPPYVQSLRITGGTIQFVGTSEFFNPNLEITAEYRNRTPEGPVQIEAHLGGTLLATELTLTSNPPMSDSDQLCFLAVGAPCVGAADRQLGSRIAQEAVLGTLSSGLSSALVGSTGLSYFNLRSLGSGSNLGGVQASPNLFDLTAVELGWYASEQVFFTLLQPLSGGVPRATMEWRFTPSWTLEARASSRYDDQFFGILGNTQLLNEQTFGLFLFREWNF